MIAKKEIGIFMSHYIFIFLFLQLMIINDWEVEKGDNIDTILMEVHNRVREGKRWAEIRMR